MVTTDHFLAKALFVSLAIHTVFVIGGYFMNYEKLEPRKRMTKGIEITYQPRKKDMDVQQRPIEPTQNLDLRQDMAMASTGTVPMKLAKDNQSPSAFSMYERKPEKMKTLEVKRRVSVVPIKSEKINNPAYASYDEMIRSRIEEKVRQNYDHLDSGYVYLAFVVDTNGNLKAAQVVAEKTDASIHLQQLALKSLKEASPFPPFFKGMTLPEYPLSIEVRYQLSD